MRGDWDSDCFRKSLWKAVLRSCKHLLSFSAWAQFRTYIFSKQCCAVAWTKGIHTAPEKISKKQCCAVAPTYSAFLLRLKIGHIFFSSTVALLRGDWDSDCFRKSLWKAVLRSCKHSLSLSAKAQIRRYIFFKQCCAVAWRLGFRLFQKKFLESSVAQLRPPSQLFC